MTHSPTEREAREAGWPALADGRWEDARDAFVAELKGEETPEAHEGLSWAAWWLDDADTVFSARKRAFQLYLERGAAASAGRLATWLAADHLDFRAASAVAGGWLRRARRLLEPLADQPDHGWLAFHEGYIAYMRGDVNRSMDQAVRAAEIGRRFAVPDLEMLGLALQGAVLVSRARIDEGMGCLDEAAAAALTREPTIPISRAWACCFLISACEATRDYARVFEWCDEIAAFSRRYRSRYMLGFCRAYYGAVFMWRGRWKDAEAELQAAREEYSRSRPAFVPGVLQQLAELRRRQGDWAECERLLDQAGGGVLCRIRLALDRGDHRRALELAQRVLRQNLESPLERAAPLELLIRAHAGTGSLGDAAAALAELEGLTRLVGTEALSAATELAGGILAAVEGQHERARQLLEDAAERFERIGAPFDGALARMELATTLFALGRSDAAERVLQLCLTSFVELGAEAELRRARRLLDRQLGKAAAPTALSEVTPREREVLRLIAEGLTNRQIAARLSVSEHTVHRHVTNILRKLELPSRAAAAAHAIRFDLVARSAK